MSDKTKKVLVVVDMQNDFLEGPLGTDHTRASIPNVVNLIKGCAWDTVILTLDTHGEDYLKTLEGEKLPVVHCVNKSAGHKVCHEVRDAIHSMENEIPDTFQWTPIMKRTFGSTDLMAELSRISDSVSGRDMEIHFCGVCTSICVLANAVLTRAFTPDAKIVIHSKACGDVDEHTHNHALECLKMQQCEVVED